MTRGRPKPETPPIPLTIRLQPDELVRLRTWARVRGVSVNTVVRQRCVDFETTAKTILDLIDNADGLPGWNEVLARLRDRLETPPDVS